MAPREGRRPAANGAGPDGGEAQARPSEPAELAEPAWVQRKFPEGFVWGVAATGYQLKVDTEEFLADSYSAFQQDIVVLRRLGLRHYHITVAWPHVQPDGHGPANAAALEFYCSLVETLLRHGIEPVVTLYHWGLPLPLQVGIGGWGSSEIVARFADYAREVFRALSIRGVKRFVTLQEPWLTAILWGGHGTAAAYRIAHHMLLAHAAAVRVFRKELCLDARGCEVGIALNADLAVPAPVPKPGSELEPGDGQVVVEELSRRAAELVLASSLGWFAGPLFAGDYPEELRACSGTAEMPVIGPEERALLMGSADFLVVRHRAVERVQASVPSDMPEPAGGWAAAAESADGGAAIWRQDPEWPISDAEEVFLPWALSGVLKWIQERYQPKGGLYVLGPGMAIHERSQTRALDDTERVQFLHDYLAEMHSALQQGVNVRGYFAWNLLDEPALPDDNGLRSGLVRMDSRSGRRTPKASARWLACVAAQNALSPASTGPGASSPSRPSLPGRGADPLWWAAEKVKAEEEQQGHGEGGAALGTDLSALANLDPHSILSTLEAVDAHLRACGETIPAHGGGSAQRGDPGHSGLKQAGLDELVSLVATEVRTLRPAQAALAITEASPAECSAEAAAASARWSEALQHAAAWKADQLGQLLADAGASEEQGQEACKALASFNPAVLAAALLLLQEERGRAPEEDGRQRDQEGSARGDATLWWIGNSMVASSEGRVVQEMSPAGEALLASLKGQDPQGEEQLTALAGLEPDTVQAVLEAVAAHLRQTSPARAGGDGEPPPAAAAGEGGSPMDVMLQVVEEVKCAQECDEAKALAKERDVPEFLPYDDPRYRGSYGAVAAPPHQWRRAVLEAEAWKSKQLELLQGVANMASVHSPEAAAMDPTLLAAVASAAQSDANAGDGPGSAESARVAVAATAAFAWASGAKAANGPSAAAAAETERRDREAWAVLVGACGDRALPPGVRA